MACCLLAPSHNPNTDFLFIVIRTLDLTDQLHTQICPQRTHDVKITSLLRQNDVATSFWRHNDVILASCVRWVMAFICLNIYKKIINNSIMIISLLLLLLIIIICGSSSFVDDHHHLWSNIYVFKNAQACCIWHCMINVCEITFWIISELIATWRPSH